MKKLLPVILAIVGLGAGVGIGVFLKPAPEEPEVAAAPCDGDPPANPELCAQEQAALAYAAELPAVHYDPEAVFEYVKLPKQFVVPIIKNDRVAALVVLSISLEVTEGTSANALARTPKLRDSFLQVLFAHANSGGFDGAFTAGQSMQDLRGSLSVMAKRILGDMMHDVLIEEIVKQTM